jgi:DNA replication protein DnaC
VENIKPLKEISTAIFSKLGMEIKGERTCEGCGSQVPIIQTAKGEVSDCLTCENLAIQKEQQEFKDEMDRKKNEIIYERFSIIPDDLQNASFENYIPRHPTQEEALKKAIWYAEKFGETEGFNSLLFKGEFGVGKSHLSKAISDVVRGQGKTVIYIDIPSLMKKIKNTFGTKETDEAIYTAIEKADLVIFDDLGAERAKKDNDGDSWVGEVLFQMFTSRTNKPKIVTTNLSADQLRAKYGVIMGGRIVSRMMKGTKPIVIEGKDMRIEEF